MCRCDSLGHGGEGQLHVQPRLRAGLHEGDAKLLHTHPEDASFVFEVHGEGHLWAGPNVNAAVFLIRADLRVYPSETAWKIELAKPRHLF